LLKGTPRISFAAGREPALLPIFPDLPVFFGYAIAVLHAEEAPFCPLPIKKSTTYREFDCTARIWYRMRLTGEVERPRLSHFHQESQLFMTYEIPAQLPIIRLKTERRHNHPWIFQKMIEKTPDKPRNGSLVDVTNPDGTWVGRGIYNGHSRIALRILTEKPEELLNEDFFRTRIGTAINLRRDILKLDSVTNAYRLVHSEGDNLSGLVVDRFNEMLVVEYFSSGMYRLRPLIEKILLEHFPDAPIYFYAEEHVQKQESTDIRSPKPPAPMTIYEHGLKFKAAPGSKHKTGFFVDQRENRKYLAELTRSIPSARVLDICCNSGGFGIYAKTLGRAAEVTGLDLDEGVIALAQENAALNDANIRYVQVDLFHWLREAIEKKEQFDVVILDPSKQTRTKEEVPRALKKYEDMNRLAMQVVKPGGILLSCSCTGLIAEHEYLDRVRRAAFQAGRQAQIFKLSGAGPDHPFMAHVAEGRYLKAVWALIL